MLTAIVMVCSLVAKDDCMQFTDRRGPYENQEQCFARVEEMVRDITPTLPLFRLNSISNVKKPKRAYAHECRISWYHIPWLQ